MKQILWVFISFLLIIGCSDKSISKKEILKGIAPPRTQLIGANIYVDIAELRNVDYLKYLSWISQIYGEKSEAYQSAIPDTTVFFTGPKKYKNIGKDYLQNQEYSEYSVVGITKAQANNFARWRTDREAEAILTNFGYLRFQPYQNPTNHFTIERYLAGTYQWTNYSVSEITLPVYSLPTDDELAVYGPKVKTKYIVKESKIQMVDSKRPAYAKGFWCVARYQKFIKKD